MADSKSRSEIAPTEDRVTQPQRNVYASPASLPAKLYGSFTANRFGVRIFSNGSLRNRTSR